MPEFGAGIESVWGVFINTGTRHTGALETDSLTLNLQVVTTHSRHTNTS